MNVLDAKAEENARIASGADPEPVAAETTETAPEEEAKPAAEEPVTPQPVDATKIQAAIPLPPPPSAAEEAAKPAVSSEPAPETEGTKVEATAVTETSEWWSQRLYKATVSLRFDNLPNLSRPTKSRTSRKF